MNTRFQSFPLVFCLLVLAASGATAADKPLKVFILAGQSNMQGHASVSTFDSMADDPKTAPLLKEMRGPDGKPRVCEKVLDLVGRLPRRRLLGPAREDWQTDDRLRRTGGQDRAGVHVRPDDGEAAGRADPHHQDGVGWSEPAHRFPAAERRAGEDQRLHTRPVDEARPRRGQGDDEDPEERWGVLPPHDRPHPEGAQGHQAGSARLRPEAGVRTGRVRLVPGVQRLRRRLDLPRPEQARRVRPVRRTARPPDP